MSKKPKSIIICPHKQATAYKKSFIKKFPEHKRLVNGMYKKVIQIPPNSQATNLFINFCEIVI